LTLVLHARDLDVAVKRDAVDFSFYGRLW
jgi:hypothetical protein